MNYDHSRNFFRYSSLSLVDQQQSQKKRLSLEERMINYSKFPRFLSLYSPAGFG